MNTIHHMPTTGGTIISKAIAACTHSILLSEINPYGFIKHPKKDVGFRPTALVEHAVGASGDLDRALKKQYFIQQLHLCQKHAKAKNKSLILREHSYTAFNLANKNSALLTILDEGEHDVRSVLSIRHPLDSFISSQKKGWHKKLAPNTKTLDEYCQNLTVFVDYMLARPHCLLMRYEDFCVDPLVEVSRAGKFYGLTVDPNDLAKAMEIPASGFSGRKSNKIEVRRRQEVSEELLETAQTAKEYRVFCERFGYEPAPEKAPINAGARI